MPTFRWCICLLLSLHVDRINAWQFAPPAKSGEQWRLLAGLDDDEQVGTSTVVVRLATRAFHPVDSRPSSRNYTPRKQEQDTVFVTKSGLTNDYNHYRTLALDNTPDRAVSILTMDTMEFLQAHGYPVQSGDLGENILIQNMRYHELQVSDKFEIVPSLLLSSNDGYDGSSTTTTKIEITEHMTPCANLCKLPYINDDSLLPRERIERCQALISLLDQEPGLRGWYAKVNVEGTVCVGDFFVRCE